MRDRTELIKRSLTWLEWLDSWGYITAGLSLLVLGMVIFAQSWIVFLQRATQSNLHPAGLKLLNDLLLVIILLELFRTVIRYLKTDVLLLEPYLAFGIIACIRRILTASAELAHLPEITAEMFTRYLLDVALNVGVIMVLIFAVFILRKRPERSVLVSSALEKAGG